ncbi:serine hydrolase [Ginsengibacter hankyongi]|uniref:Serine hydrolase n=1 Tax=Ginsengibacter hankyongi TaxID=2607284 RepID=A0A5J5IE44_9BACT|nr:serine hydrolase [Ginsengibacter hankyongi]KAA9037986.1 serine hydrolase [Ginsengibacter hankyongi]
MKNKILIVFFSFFFSSVADAQTIYFPDTIWQVKTPAEMKMNQVLLDSAVKFAQANENKKFDRDMRIGTLKAYADEPDFKIIGPTKERGGPAGLIIKNGYIVAQWGDINRVDMTNSVTKSFLSTVAGLAVDERLIKNVTDKVNTYVWDGTFEGPHNSKITWDNLLTQSSDWSGTQFGLPDWADRPPKEGSIDDWKNRKLNEPGTVFKYNDVRVNVLAYSLLQVWRKPLPMILKKKIMDPIGASTTWRWYGYDNSFVNIDGIMMQSVSGGGHHGGGLFISASDQARFGLLFLRKGKWKTQQLISEKWVKAVHQSSSANKAYGYMWWINSSKKWKDISPEIYYADGAGGNYIVIDNEHDLVVVTRWIDESKMDEFMNLVEQSITNQSNRN